jgi:hypothetical protein
MADVYGLETPKLSPALFRCSPSRLFEQITKKENGFPTASADWKTILLFASRF